jgi:hypothetical protein
MRRISDDRGSSGNAKGDFRRNPPKDAESDSEFWTFTILVAGAVLIALLIAAVAGGYLP